MFDVSGCRVVDRVVCHLNCFSEFLSQKGELAPGPDWSSSWTNQSSGFEDPDGALMLSKVCVCVCFTQHGDGLFAKVAVNSAPSTLREH